MWDMVTYQVPAPTFQFPAARGVDYCRWLQRFERFRQASDLEKKSDKKQVNALVYAMGMSPMTF